MKTALLKAAALALAAFAAAPLAHAQPYPSKPIRIVVPFPAGGTTDVVSRLVAQRMSESLGQPVLVENRGGAGGSLGADVVAKAPPDGYTILMHNITFPLASSALAMAGRAPYDIDNDFAGIGVSVNVPFIFTAHPKVPANDLKELVALLQKDKSLKYNYGSTGPGSAMHVFGELIKRDGKVEMTHIPFKGAAPLKQELLAGRLEFGGDQLSSSLAEVKSGKLKAFATGSAQRLAVLPDVPTVREQGFARLEFQGWNGLFAPARTPRDIIERLSKEAGAAIRHPEVVKRLNEIAAEPVGSSPADQDAVLKKQVAQFKPLIKELGITLD